MLTATYTFVALSVEQASMRVSLQSLQQLLQSNFLDRTVLTTGQVDYACDVLHRVFDFCRWRKIEKFLIPAIRGTTHDADQLLLDLNELSRAAAEAMGASAQHLETVAIDSEARVAEFCASIDAFCRAMLTRLEREEKELFPLARAVISGEAWFSIANQMLAHDAYRKENRPERDSIPTGPAAVDHVKPVHTERILRKPFPVTFAQ
jgi:hemerythrin-like domain-containing protein